MPSGVIHDELTQSIQLIQGFYGLFVGPALRKRCNGSFSIYQEKSKLGGIQRFLASSHPLAWLVKSVLASRSSPQKESPSRRVWPGHDDALNDFIHRLQQTLHWLVLTLGNKLAMPGVMPSNSNRAMSAGRVPFPGLFEVLESDQLIHVGRGELL